MRNKTEIIASLIESFLDTATAFLYSGIDALYFSLTEVKRHRQIKDL